MKSATIVSVAVLGAFFSSYAEADVKPQQTTQSVICKLSGTCDPQAAPSTGNVSENSGSTDVGSEKSFTLFSGSTAGQAAKSHVGAPASSGPKLVSVPTHSALSGAPHVAANQGARHYAGHVRPATDGVQRSADMLMSFQSGSAELSEQAMVDARVFAAALQSTTLSAGNYIVEGHTDSIGGRPYNRALSQRRAQAVVDYLVKQGVPANHLTAKGFGFDRPKQGLRSNDPANRRVELVKAN